MFHIHTLNGDHYDLTLESLLHRKGVTGTGSNSPVRRFIPGEEGGEGTGDGRIISYAEKSYREAVNIKNEREPLFHAWQIMSSPVKTVSPGMKVTEAWAWLMKEKICHAPVISEDGKLTGIISDRDLLKSLIVTGGEIVNHTEEIVENIMISEVITAGRMTDIRRIAKVMFDGHIGSMPILDDSRKLTGIITRSDILHALVNHPPLKLWG